VYRHSSADVSAATLVPVEAVEVGDDDGHRQRYGEYAGDDAQRADQLAPHTAYLSHIASNQLAPDADRCDVAVADRRHGDDGPPERFRYRRELRARLADLGVVGGRAEDHHGDEQEEEEHAELVQTGLDRQPEDPQTLQWQDNPVLSDLQVSKYNKKRIR